MSLVSHEQTSYFQINEARISPVISASVANNQYPDGIRIPGVDIDGELRVEYTLDAALQLPHSKTESSCHIDRRLVLGASPKAANDFGRLAASILLNSGHSNLTA